MRIQVKSDETIAVDASLIRLVEGEVRRLFGRFTIRLTRMEIHLSDVGGTQPVPESTPAGKRSAVTILGHHRGDHYRVEVC
jgi:hypothetical protein